MFYADLLNGTMNKSSLDRVFMALADKNRRAILQILLESDLSVSEIAASFDLSVAAISKHVAVLAAAGLVTKRKKGRMTICGLEPGGLADAGAWLDSFGFYDLTDLDRIEQFLDIDH